MCASVSVQVMLSLGAACGL